MQYKRILIALSGSVVDPDLVRVAAALAKPVRAEVVAVHVIEVRWNLPLDAVLDAELDRGERLLEEATKIARTVGIALETEVLQAREAAAAIIDSARERRADLIIVGSPYRRRLGRVHIGRTTQTVYEKAPCAVLAYREPEPS